MSIFGNIMSAIFGPRSAAQAAPHSDTPTGSASPAGPSSPQAAPQSGRPTSAASPAGAAPPSAATAPAATVDVEAVLTDLAARKKQKLDWRRSIVDLMKLLDLDSSLSARKELARELAYSGDTNDSAAMNIWLHKQVMRKLAENGGKVPEDLRAA